MQSSISTLNKQRWSGRLAGHMYRNAGDLFPPEQAILEQISGSARGQRILDIGVGTGRTTGPLRDLSSRYTGIDYSAEMIQRAKKRHPDADYMCLDARDLGAFSDGNFDLVWFSFNGIDYVSHEDRIQILREIRRVLRQGGWFCFSSHNRDHAGLQQDLGLPAFEFTANPIKLAFRTAMRARALFNAWALKEREIRSEAYAILNDTELQNGLLTYYISLPAQVDQLNRLAFGRVRAFDLNGEQLDTGNPYVAGYMIHYLAEAV